MEKNDEIDTFSSFWKYMGLFSVFAIGVFLFYSGIDIILHDWFRIRSQMGFIGHIVLAPFIIGFALSWLSATELVRVFKE